MKDTVKLGFNKYMQPLNSPAGTPSEYKMALDWDINRERTPYLNPTQVSKGTVQTNLGGILDLRDKTGGTSILTYNPTTGVVTILGSLVAQSVNTGTYTSITIAGNNPITGTLQNGVYGTALFKGGTVNAILQNNAGTPGVAGTAIYVKTVDFVGSTTTLGTLQFSDGLLISST